MSRVRALAKALEFLIQRQKRNTNSTEIELTFAKCIRPTSIYSRLSAFPTYKLLCITADTELYSLGEYLILVPEASGLGRMKSSANKMKRKERAKARQRRRDKGRWEINFAKLITSGGNPL